MFRLIFARRTYAVERPHKSIIIIIEIGSNIILELRIGHINVDLKILISPNK